MVLVAGKMYRPTDVTVDIATNSVYVVEQFNHRISKWDYTDTNYDFTLDASWGSNSDGTSGEGAPIGDGGPTDNALYRPSGITFDDANSTLYVTDTFHNRVRVVNPGTGAFIESVGQGGSGVADFYHPAGIAIETVTHNSFIIADELNNRIMYYNTNGGSPSPTLVLDDPSIHDDLSFIRPHGAVYDRTTDEYYVCDSPRGTITSYNIGGGYIEQFGTPGTTGTDLFFPGSGEGTLTGNGTTAFADTRNNTLKTLDSVVANTTGTTPGTGDGQLYYPESVNSFEDAATNYVLAANTLNNRVEAYSNAGTALTFQNNFGSP